jgi:hypothetical protein
MTQSIPTHAEPLHGSCVEAALVGDLGSGTVNVPVTA